MGYMFGRRKITAFSVALALVFCGAFLAMASPLSLDGNGVYYPASKLEILEDQNKTIAIGDLALPDVSSRFKPTHWIGWTNGAIWYRLTVQNTADSPADLRLQIFHPWVSNVEFYAADGKGGYAVMRAGAAIQRRDWGYDNPLPTFPIIAPARGSTTVYLRAMSEDLFQIPFMLTTRDTFERVDFYTDAFIAMFVGAALALLLYNLLLYVSLRDKSYLMYVLYITSMLLLVLSLKGFAFQYLWPDSPVWGSRFNHLFGSLVQITGIMFGRYFLDTKNWAPRLDKTMKWYAYAHLAYLPFIYPWPSAMFAPASAFTEASPLVFDFLLFYAGVAALKRGDRAARYFVVSTISTIVGMAIFILGVLGAVPYGLFTDNVMEVGFLLEIVLLSLALADRIAIIQAERTAAQHLALENQLKLSRHLENAKEELETQVIKRTQELQVSKEMAERATKLKDKFVSLVSHDLKGPIGAIRGLMRMAQDEKSDMKLMHELSTRVYNSSSGLLEMIDKLLDISRLQTGSIQPEKRVFYLFAIAEETFFKLGPLAEAKGIALRSDVPRNIRILADRTLIGEVLANLVSNAIKFTPQGGAVTVFAPGPRTLAVRDTGAGIPEKILPDLFRADVKTTGVGTAGETGTGLGLPLCEDIMKAHGGNMRVETGPEGTTFFATFPDAKPVVMLVDDQEVHRAMMKEQIIKISNVDFIEAGNGREAMEKLVECDPVLVITDINMPEMDGFEFLRELRRWHTITELPVIVSTALTGSSSPTTEKTIDNKTFAFELGANDFIMKPIVPAEFVPRVKRYLP
jgi:signal transduction histidine kinase